ncbi:MAG: hypothetical protein QW041_03010 [Candidatus Pacearchaeota archaeon]
MNKINKNLLIVFLTGIVGLQNLSAQEIKKIPRKKAEKTTISYEIKKSTSVPTYNIKTSTESFKVEKSTFPLAVEKSTSSYSLEKSTSPIPFIKLNYGLENGYRIFEGSCRVIKNWWLNFMLSDRKYSIIENKTEKIGSRFDAYGKTKEEKINNTYSIELEYKKNLKNFNNFSCDAIFGGILYNNLTESTNTIEERIQDKNGNVLASETNVYNTKKTENELKIKAGMEWAYKHFNLTASGNFGSKDRTIRITIGYKK